MEKERSVGNHLGTNLPNMLKAGCFKTTAPFFHSPSGYKYTSIPKLFRTG